MTISERSAAGVAVPDTRPAAEATELIRDVTDELIYALHPRPDFKRRILHAFFEGVAPRPETTFGNVKADVLAHYVPGFTRGGFVTTVPESPWPE